MPEPPLDVSPELDSLSARIGAIEARLGERPASKDGDSDVQTLDLLRRAIDMLAGLEKDWVRAHAEASTLRTRLREAESNAGDLQQEIERIVLLCRTREAEWSATRDDLARQVESGRQEISRVDAAFRAAVDERDAAIRECRELQTRVSWRLTAPLRATLSLLRGKR